MKAIKALFLAFFGAHRQVSWRRLAVFVAACLMLWYGKIGEWPWAAIAMVFIGGEAVKQFSAVASGIPGGASATATLRELVPGSETDPDAGE